MRQAPADRVKYVLIGSAVLTTGVLALVSMFIGLRMAVGAPIWAAVPLSVLWFLAIVNLDRWLVVSLQRTGHKRHALGIALPRIALALLFGLIISTPLTLQIFDHDVQKAVEQLHGEASRDFLREQANGPDSQRVKVLEQRQATLLAQRDGSGLVNTENDPEIKSLRGQLPALQKDFTDNDDSAACELKGERCKNGAKGKSGDGPEYQKYVKRRDAAKTQIDQVEKKIDDKAKALRAAAVQSKGAVVAQAEQALPGVQNELNTLRQLQRRERADFERANGANDGLLIRIKGLNRAAHDEGRVYWSRILLFAFVTILECLPLIVRGLQLFTPAAAYEDAVRQRRARDRQLLDEHLREQEAAGLRENEERLDHAEYVAHRRAESLRQLAGRTIDRETRVHQDELDRWEDERMRALSRRGSEPGANEWGRPINARVIRGQDDTPAGATRDDITIYPPARQRQGLWGRLFGRRR
ncbi:DUF4407 domain-containing protein [Actinomadura barringtoniae]|uniref:DUF4407 domain-containing protein n=1 Tax=Actinomadura barringtoniae TaxID=1427535 RepID=A0A939P677_9ACTN|nr:DUF4407 domain-containing protein [Actinomadura barringtoniae]MBO2446060.1 DUF4407 domain-containing protein [Actinomadura barringtoniae]